MVFYGFLLFSMVCFFVPSSCIVFYSFHISLCVSIVLCGFLLCFWILIVFRIRPAETISNQLSNPGQLNPGQYQFQHILTDQDSPELSWSLRICEISAFLHGFGWPGVVLVGQANWNHERSPYCGPLGFTMARWSLLWPRHKDSTPFYGFL